MPVRLRLLKRLPLMLLGKVLNLLLEVLERMSGLLSQH